jgi:hypothetical protein
VSETAVSYYARRSARDPDWHAEQLAAAADRARQRRAADVDAARKRARLAARRCRRQHAAAGLTLHALWLRVGGDRDELALILRDEVRRGRVEYRSTSRRYVLNGEIDAATRAALRAL